MKKCLIISGGEKTELSKDYSDYFIIACDKGYSHAVDYGLKVDLLVGDFDSFEGEMPMDVEIERLPVEKDDTDTMHAIRSAIERGYMDITICCCFGGRIDHMYANIQSGAFAKENGANVKLFDSNNVIYYIKEEQKTFVKKENTSLSLFSYSDQCEGVTINGAKYNITDTTINNRFPIGQSNEWEEDEITVNCESGLLLAIVSKK